MSFVLRRFNVTSQTRVPLFSAGHGRNFRGSAGPTEEGFARVLPEESGHPAGRWPDGWEQTGGNSGLGGRWENGRQYRVKGLLIKSDVPEFLHFEAGVNVGKILCCPEEENTARAEGGFHFLKKYALPFAGKIDADVAAKNQIERSERAEFRQQVELPERDAFLQFGVNGPVSSLGLEIAAGEIFREPATHGEFVIDAGPGGFDGFRGNVRAEVSKFSGVNTPSP